MKNQTNSPCAFNPPSRDPGRLSRFASPEPGRAPRSWLLTPLTLLLATAGCTFVTYTSPSGERFARSSFGANTAISSLCVDADTNGVRRLELQGYQSESSQALGAVTEAAVKAAIQGANPLP